MSLHSTLVRSATAHPLPHVQRQAAFPEKLQNSWPRARHAVCALAASTFSLKAKRKHLQQVGQAAAANEPSATESTEEGITFSETLWQQFLGIATPYFISVPDKEVKSASGNDFLPLVFALLLGVVSGTYCLAVGVATLATGDFVPLSWASAFPPALATGVTSLLQSGSTFLPAAGIGVSVSAAAFYSSREKLEGKWQQWGTLALLVFLLLCVTGLSVLFSYVFRAIDNMLVAKNAEAYFQQVIFFAAVLVVAVPVFSGYKFIKFQLSRQWRGYLTELFLEKYMANKSYYLLDSNSASSAGLDNPDQRIAEDIDFFTKETLQFLMDVLDSVLSLASFATILWATSQQLTLALVVYAVIGTLIAAYIGAELIRINYTQLRLQANLRYSLVHVRDNAEAIAFYGGEQREKADVSGRLDSALTNYDRLIIWKTGLAAYQKLFTYLARLVPLFVLGGLYFAGEFDFGTLGQAQFAFSRVLSSVALIVNRMQGISRFAAGIARLGVFWDTLETGSRATAQPADHIAIQELRPGQGTGVMLHEMTLTTPDGSRMLIENLTLGLGEGKKKRLLVVGSSGVGKSSVLRGLAGLWTRGNGSIQRPEAKSMLFLPQRPYMPLGDLRTQLLYPAEGTLDLGHSDAELQQILARFGLGHLPERFDGGFEAVQDWARVLSLGEQQRLAAARCLVSHPRFIVLDEATSALPLHMEQFVYECFEKESSIEGYISVGHRTSLSKYHDIVLEVLGDGKWRTMTPKEYLKKYSKM